MTLPQWQAAIVRQGELYRVGGAVRDELMGIPHSAEDVDYLVRGVTPRELEALLGRFGRIVLVGKSFGVYKFKPTGAACEYDIAFPRREVSTGAGHREFAIESDETLPVEADLGRRDFTINAIASNVVDGRLVDPFGGRIDIEKQCLRMIFPEAFREDPLRILRGIRFAARFALQAEAATWHAMRDGVRLLPTLSAERVQEELTKTLLQCERPSAAFAMLHDIGALGVVLPELDRAVGVDQNVYHPDDVFWHSVKSCDCAPRDKLLVRWAALLHDLGKVDAKQIVREGDEPRVVFYGHEKISARLGRGVLERLRYGGAFVNRCVHLVLHHMIHYEPQWSDASVRRFIRTVGADNVEDLFDLKRADLMSRNLAGRLDEIAELRRRVDGELRAEQALKIRDLAIDGNDVMVVVGTGPGEAVGRILNEIFDRVIEDPSLNERAKLLKILEMYRTDGE